MAEERAGKSGKLVIRNIGLLLSGDLDRRSSMPIPSSRSTA